MRIFRIIRSLQNKSNFRKYFSNFTNTASVRLTNIQSHTPKIPLNHHNIGKYSTENDEELEDYSLIETDALDIMEQTKYILFKDSKDNVINELNGCNNMEDVWNTLNAHKNNLNDEQLTQSVLVLKDIQIKFCKVNSKRINPSFEFLNQLKNSKEFDGLISTIMSSIENFNTNYLSFVFLYLQRIGMNIEEEPMLMIGQKLKNDLEQEFDLSVCSRFLKVIFLENSVRPYYMSLNLIPKIIEALGKYLYIYLVKNRLSNQKCSPGFFL